MAAPEESSCVCAAYLDMVELEREVEAGPVCLCATTP